MEDKIEHKDSNGNILVEGDSVLLIKDLKVKGFNKDLKRGTVVKNIRLTSDPGAVEGKVEGSILVLKTMYLRKK
jgi:protein PhnA